MTIGFPTTSHEEWRFTNVAPLAQTDLGVASGGRAVTEKEIERFIYPDCHQLVLVNGALAPDLSRLEGLPEGVVLSSLAAARQSHPELVEAHLGRYAEFDDHAFVARPRRSPRRSFRACCSSRRKAARRRSSSST